MAYIQEKTNAKGEKVYKIKVSCGYDVNGKQITRTKTFKPDPKMTPKQIEKEVNRQAVLFENEVKMNNSEKRTYKFEVIAEEWISFEEQHNTLKLSTLEMYKGMRKRIFKGLGHLQISKIKRTHIQKFIDDLATGADGFQALSAKSQKNYLCFLSNVFGYAMKQDIVETNPCKGISFSKGEKKERQYYSVDEEVQLLTRLKDKNAPLNYQLFFSLVIYLGLRKGEALGIEWSDIDFSNGTVFIHRQIQYRNKKTGMFKTTPKTKSSIRTLTLSQKIIDLLKLVKLEQEQNKIKCGDLWENSDNVISNWCGKPIFPSQPYNYLKNFCKREDLPFKAIHAFRHSLVTNLIHNNVDVATVSSIVGHASPNVTLAVYTHEVKESTVIGCEKMASLIDSMGETMSK